MAKHQGPIFKATEKRVCAYQHEFVMGGGRLAGRESDRPMPEIRVACTNRKHLELVFVCETQRHVGVRLRISRTDIVEQRRKWGWAIESEDYVAVMSLGELCNRIFGPGCDVYENEEHFPESVKAAMQQAYGDA